MVKKILIETAEISVGMFAKEQAVANLTFVGCSSLEESGVLPSSS